MDIQLNNEYLTVCRPHHAVAFLPSDGKTVFGDLELRGSIVQRQQHHAGAQRPVQPPGDGLTAPLIALVELLER
jgi:hypothetical protein